MAFEYCCFVSYPHGQDDVLVPWAKSFVEGLKQEIGAQIRGKIFLDNNFFMAGDWLEESIGSNLCKSACMILLYTPLYFDTEHVYCARELKAMQELEEQRLKHLPKKGKGLIIPVILRGEKKFPDVLKAQRYCSDFSLVDFNDPVKTIRTKYKKKIREIADYIIERCDELKAITHKISHDCDNYQLPSAEVAIEFVETVLETKIVDNPVGFVGRDTEPGSGGGNGE
jgi:hypothetical protein